MKVRVKKIIFAVWIALLGLSYVTTVSAKTGTPTDQEISGPFTITTEWQTIILASPLKTLPYIQLLEALFPQSDYKNIEGIERGPYWGLSTSLQRLSDNKVIKLAMILIERSGNEYQMEFASLGNAPISTVAISVLDSLHWALAAIQIRGSFITRKRPNLSPSRSKPIPHSPSVISSGQPPTTLSIPVKPGKTFLLKK